MLRFSTLARVVALAGLVACAAPVVSLSPPPKSFTPDEYPDVYERWTRTLHPFDFGEMRSVLHAAATFESREFRWAYVVRYADDFELPTDARNAMLAASMADADEHHRFFVTIGGGKPREMDLTDAEGAWRVLLMDDRGRMVRPLEIQPLGGGTASEKAYFPAVSPFRRAFRVVFPAFHEDGQPTIPPEALFAVLRFTGPEGQLDLKWEFTRP
ncbi:MAG: hypothetical protein QM778_05250 [Myxococcales bacterium]